MKFSIITSLLALGASSVLATPTAEPADAIASVESRDTSSSPSSAVIEKRATLATKKKKTDTLMWNTDLEYFQYERRRKNPSYLVWASDGCTDSPDYPFKWPFVKGCYRHDFGYRNYKKQKRFNKANKKKIDLKFHKDLSYVCKKHSSVASRLTCMRLADQYYNIMRLATWAQVKREEQGQGAEDIISARDQAWAEAVAEAVRDIEARGLTMEETYIPEDELEVN